MSPLLVSIVIIRQRTIFLVDIIMNNGLVFHCREYQGHENSASRRQTILLVELKWSASLFWYSQAIGNGSQLRINPVVSWMLPRCIIFEGTPYRDGIKVKLYHMIEGFNSVRMDGQLMRLAFADFRKFSFQQLKHVQLGDITSAYSSLGAMEAI